MRKIQIALLTLLTAVLMTACFESKDSATADLASQVAGEYNFFSLTASGKTFNLTEYLALSGGEVTLFIFSKVDATTLKAESFTVKNGTRRSDGPAGTIRLTDMGGGSIKLDDASAPNAGGAITYKDGSLTFTDNSSVVVYKKK